ncbi:zinc ribbon domain-containing protein [Humidesulfovibrio mexicanus]|nr:zinc ribbon domain-containing protein [Humidesulfovibrio mexicanus]
MIPCPACKKKISDAAEACPKCGQPITEQDREAGRAKVKKGQMGCGLALLAVVVLVVIGNLGSTDKKSTEQAATPTAEQEQVVEATTPTLAYTAEAIVERFNQAARKMDFHHKARITKNSSGPAASSMQVKVGKHIGLVIATPNDAPNASGVMLIGVGDGTIQSGAAIIEGMVVLIATLSPELDAAGRGGVLRELGLLGGEKSSDQTSAIRGKVKYSYGFVEGMGTIFGADAI